MSNEVWEEMDDKVVNAICLNQCNVSVRHTQVQKTLEA